MSDFSELISFKKTEKKCGLNLSITFNTGINALCLIRSWLLPETGIQNI